MKFSLIYISNFVLQYKACMSSILIVCAHVFFDLSKHFWKVLNDNSMTATPIFANEAGLSKSL
ncbi:hypothetical protein SAMN04487950_2857 [Halogranum rubrum]|uniref:Uncharacterized protein n=1 Tax=Halogranum rubrum TaxID=553466 RepID=A0A1I4FVZ9_9EURY|nr:hypothetical protein SAMN04487950_2857 [Halogranum rubrum]